jgi:phosphoadenosine phosphosulfate reductase
MSELEKKVQKSIERLKAFEPPEGYYLAFSGGKDSVTCKALLDMAGCKYDAFYRVTTVDPPELVRFIKDVHPDVKREIPRYSQEYRNKKLAGKPITMWNLIPEKMMPPTRLARFCCAALKESGGDGRMTVTGVRWEESSNRKNNQGILTVFGAKAAKELEENKNFIKAPKGGVVLVNDNDENRKMIEQCYKRHKTNINPIIDWSDKDVWQFIRSNGIPYCELYNEGFHRLGCVGCPMARKRNREIEFLRWPKYKDSYMRSFEKMLEVRKERNRPFKCSGTVYKNATAKDVFN